MHGNLGMKYKMKVSPVCRTVDTKCDSESVRKKSVTVLWEFEIFRVPDEISMDFTSQHSISLLSKATVLIIYD